jgi:hypothetical protein
MMNAWVPQEEVTVHDKPEYFFALEEFRRSRASDAGTDQMVFLHLTVHEWKPSVFKEILRNWKIFRKHVTCPLYVVGGVEDVEKWEAFVSLLGFKPFIDVVLENGRSRRLFVHFAGATSVKEHNKATHELIATDEQHRVKHRDDCPVVSASPLPDAGIQRRG